MPTYHHEVIICGHGLAGAVLAHHLHRRGISFHVFDRKCDGNASSAAAGIINPLSLRRDVLTWRAHEMLRISREFYEDLGEWLGARIWHPIELIKIFPTPHEEAQWRRAMSREETRDLLSIRNGGDLASTGIPAPHGLGIIEQSAWLDIRTMLDRQRSRLLADGRLTNSWLDAEKIRSHGHGIAVGAHTARWIVHCNGPFASLKGLVPVKGEVLTVRLPEFRLQQMVHRGIFILPIGAGLFRIGSTFEWNNVWSGPSEATRIHLLKKFSEIVPGPVEVIEHLAGVRPASRDRRPILGVALPGQAIFNGLGARGGLLAPWCAMHLIEHLLEGRPLDQEVDPARFNSL